MSNGQTVWTKRSNGTYSIGTVIAPDRRYLSKQQEHSGYRLIRTGGTIRRVHTQHVRPCSKHVPERSGGAIDCSSGIKETSGTLYTIESNLQSLARSIPYQWKSYGWLGGVRLTAEVASGAVAKARTQCVMFDKIFFRPETPVGLLREPKDKSCAVVAGWILEDLQYAETKLGELINEIKQSGGQELEIAQYNLYAQQAWTRVNTARTNLELSLR